MTVYGCEAGKVGGIYVSKGAHLSLVDVSIEECSSAHTGNAGGLDSAGFLHAERVRVVRCNLLRPMSGQRVCSMVSSARSSSNCLDRNSPALSVCSVPTMRVGSLRPSSVRQGGRRAWAAAVRVAGALAARFA